MYSCVVFDIGKKLGIYTRVKHFIMNTKIIESTSSSEVETEKTFLDDVDGGYGWVIVFASFLLTFSTWGLNSAYGIFFTYYINSNHFRNANIMDYAIIGGLSVGLGPIFAPVTNYLQGRIGTRTTILLGNILQFAACMLASFSTELWQLYLTQGALISLGLSIITSTSMTITSQWFIKKRVLANLIASTGSAIGGIVFNLGTQKIIQVKDVGWALRAEAIISVTLIAIANLLIRTKSKKHNVQFTFIDADCLNCTAFWLYCFHSITTLFGYVTILYCLSAFTVSLGFTQYQGSIVATMAQVGMCIGRPAAGYLSDSFGALTISGVMYMVATIFTLALWIPSKTYSMALALAFCEGLFIGTIYPTSGPILVRIVGISKMNVAFNMLIISWGIGSLGAMIIAAALTSGTGTSQFHNTAIFAGVSFFASTVALILLRGYIITRDNILMQTENKEVDVLGNHLYIDVPIIGIFNNCLSLSPNKV